MHKNILLIFTDQQRFDTIAAHGNPVIQTPSLDSLAKDGVSFRRAYSPCPVCIPARYAMHTGLMPHKTDCVYNDIMPEGNRSFMEVLSEHGYQTHGVGKMHFAFEDKETSTLWGYGSRDVSEELGEPDDYTRFLQEHDYGHVHEPNGIRGDMYYTPQPSQLPARLHNSSWVVDRSIDFLESRDAAAPFMLMTSFIKPHPPFETPTPWNKLYRGPEMPLPKQPVTAEVLTTYWNAFQNRYKYFDRGISEHAVRTMKAAYYATISFIDYQVGRLLSYLKEHDLYEDTLIIFSSDHGELLGDYDCLGKRCFLDSASRIPLIMVHPDLPSGCSTEAPVSLVDVFPTMLQYAGIPAEELLCGKSLKDVYEDPSDRDIIFGQYHHHDKALYMSVSERFKYIYSVPDRKEWLFDLKTDPGEIHNKSGNPFYSKHVRMMRASLISYFRKEGYLEPLEGERFKDYELPVRPRELDELLLFQDAEGSLPKIPGYEREQDIELSPLLQDSF